MKPLGFCHGDCEYLVPNKYDKKILACSKLTMGELAAFEKEEVENCPVYANEREAAKFYYDIYPKEQREGQSIQVNFQGPLLTPLGVVPCIFATKVEKDKKGNATYIRLEIFGTWNERFKK